MNNTEVDNAKDVDVVMSMYNLTKCSDNYSNKFGSMWQYCKNIPAVNRNGDIVDFNEPNVTELFSFKRKVTEQRGVDETKDAKITVPWK